MKGIVWRLPTKEDCDKCSQPGNCEPWCVHCASDSCVLQEGFNTEDEKTEDERDDGGWMHVDSCACPY